MTMPPLPQEGYPRKGHPEDPTWTGWAQVVHDATTEVVEGRLIDASLKAALEARVDRTGATTGEVPVLQGDGTLAFGPPAAGYTDEQVRDVVAATLVAGANVTITPADAADTITIAATGSGGATATWANVKDYGAVGDGIANDTAAIQAAAATGKTVFFPAGTYKCAPNLDLAEPKIVGAGRGDVTIALDPGAFLVDSNQVWTDTHIEGITVDGGKGAIRNRYTGSNVTRTHTVIDCNFLNYTGAAISAEASDMPLWRIERCLFNAANQTGTIGIALPGLTDTDLIRSCEFQENYVHVKLGNGGNNAYVLNNDFVQYNAAAAGLRRTMIWVVPRVGATNAGAGAVFADNKYGNENLGVDDLRIAYADEGAGTYFGDRLPNYGADSTGYIVAHTIRGGLINGAGSTGNPFVYSTTPNVRGCRIGEQVLGGTLPSYLFQLRTTSTTHNPEVAGNVLGPFRTPDRAFAPLSLTNQPSMFLVRDESQVTETTAGAPASLPGGARATGFTNLLSQRINGFTYSGATKTQITDAVGGTDAVEIVLNSGDVYAYPAAGALKADTPVWIEFDMQAGSTGPIGNMYVDFGLDTAGSGGASQFFRRRITPSTAGWASYRFLTMAPLASNSVTLHFTRVSGTTGANVRIGRVRMYHAREPITTDLVLPDTTTTTTAPTAGGAGALPATPAGYVTVFINGVARKLPYY